MYQNIEMTNVSTLNILLFSDHVAILNKKYSIVLIIYNQQPLQNFVYAHIRTNFITCQI